MGLHLPKTVNALTIFGKCKIVLPILMALVKVYMLTKEQVNAVKNNDIVNILKAQKAGRKLTASDRKALDEAGDQSSFGIVDSMRAASVRCAIPVEILKAVKRTGSNAFRPNGRVDCDAVMDYLKQHPELQSHQDDELSYEREKTLHERAKRQIAENRLALQTGELVRVKRVEMIWSNILLAARDAVLSLPGKIAPQILFCKDAGEVKAMLEKAINDYLITMQAKMDYVDPEDLAGAESAEANLPAQDAADSQPMG